MQMMSVGYRAHGSAGAMAYVMHNNKMKDLEKQYEAGQITQAEFESRKKQIEDESLLQRLDQKDQPASS